MTSHSQPVGAPERIECPLYECAGSLLLLMDMGGKFYRCDYCKSRYTHEYIESARSKPVHPMPQGIANAINAARNPHWVDGGLTFVNASDAVTLADALESTTQRLALMESQSIELQNLVFVPGVFKCSKCEFGLVANIIHSRGISANNDVQLCMNGCGILDQVTERDERIALFKLNDEQLDRIKELESQLPRVFTAETIGDAPEGQYMILCNEGWTGAWEQKILGLKPISMVRDYLSDMDDCRAYGPIEGQVR